MISFSFYKWIILSSLILIIGSCFDDQRKENNNPSIPSLANSDYKPNSAIKIETSGGEDFQMKLWQKGIDFYARGNEPFWALDMDFDKGFYFNTLNGLEFNTPPVEGTKALDANVIHYFAETESGTLVITILKEKCNDTMSDEVFSNKVRIEVKNLKEDEYSIFEGCGRYVADYSLHDIWVLTHVNGKGLQSGDSKDKRLPVFEFYAREGKVLGNTACNDFSGNYYISGFREIQFADMVITKKMCPDMKTENLLVKSVFGKRMKYQREDLKLTLSGNDDTNLILKKID